MIIKMVNEFKLTVVHFARPNPMQICACAVGEGPDQWLGGTLECSVDRVV